MAIKMSFIFPSIYFGGHEIMALEIMTHLRELHSVSVLAYINKDNSALRNALIKLNIDFELYRGFSSKVKIITHFFHFWNCISVIKTLRKATDYSGADHVYLVQGSIELGADFVFWSWLLDIKLVSYIPFAHSAHRLNLKCSHIREFLAGIYFRMCNNYITISDVFAKQLLSYNKNANVSICRNFISGNRLEYSSLQNHPVNDSVVNIFVIGRIVFSQKGQDIAAQAFVDFANQYRSLLTKKVMFHFVGDGPDLASLKKYINSCGDVASLFVFHGWIERWWEIYIKPDLIVIPSHFEGVPLVMLEAIMLGVPLVATNVDGMTDYLDKAALFDLQVDSIIFQIYSFLTNEQHYNRCSQYKLDKNSLEVDLTSFLGISCCDCKSE